jgi:nicotinamidase-related amidase
MQNEVLHPDGFFHRKGYLQLSGEERALLLTNVNRLAAKMREAQLPVIHGFWSLRPDYLDACFSQQWRRRGLQENGAFVQDTFGAAFVDGLALGEDDFFVPLKSHSAFQFTPLDRILRNCKAETCILVGGTASGSVDDSTRQGTAYGYRMLLVPDAIYPLNSPYVRGMTNRGEIIMTDDLLELISLEDLPFPLLAAAR